MLIKKSFISFRTCSIPGTPVVHRMTMLYVSTSDQVNHHNREAWDNKWWIDSEEFMILIFVGDYADG